MRKYLALGINRRVAGIAASVVGFLVFITVAFGSWYTIDQGELGVLLTNGKIADVVGAGLHFKMPWFQGVQTISIRQQVSRWSCTDTKQTCNPSGDNQFNNYVMEAYSKDQQPATMTVSVNWHVSDADIVKVYSSYQNLSNINSQVMNRIIPQEVKTVFGQYDAASVIQNRSQFNADVTAAITKSVAPTSAVVIDSAQVEDIAFSAVYEQAVEQRMQAQVGVDKQQAQLLQEKVNADIAATQATGAANAVKAKADGDAYSIKANADAQAYSTQVNGQALATAIKAQADALNTSPHYVEFMQAQRWNGILPSTMLPGGSVPFLNVTPNAIAAPTK